MLELMKDPVYNAATVAESLGPLMDAFDRQHLRTDIDKLRQVREDGAEWKKFTRQNGIKVGRQNAIKIGNGEKLYKKTKAGGFIRNVEAFSDLMSSSLSVNRIFQGLTIIGPPTMVFFDLFLGSAADKQ